MPQIKLMFVCRTNVSALVSILSTKNAVPVRDFFLWGAQSAFLAPGAQPNEKPNEQESKPPKRYTLNAPPIPPTPNPPVCVINRKLVPAKAGIANRNHPLSSVFRLSTLVAKRRFRNAVIRNPIYLLCDNSRLISAGASGPGGSLPSAPTQHSKFKTNYRPPIYCAPISIPTQNSTLKIQN